MTPSNKNPPATSNKKRNWWLAMIAAPLSSPGKEWDVWVGRECKLLSSPFPWLGKRKKGGWLKKHWFSVIEKAIIVFYRSWFWEQAISFLLRWYIGTFHHYIRSFYLWGLLYQRWESLFFSRVKFYLISWQLSRRKEREIRTGGGCTLIANLIFNFQFLLNFNQHCIVGERG